MKKVRWSRFSRNEGCAEIQQLEDLQIVSKLETKLRWFDHVGRRDKDCVGRTMLEIDPASRRKKGPKWLEDSVIENMYLWLV